MSYVAQQVPVNGVFKTHNSPISNLSCCSNAQCSFCGRGHIFHVQPSVQTTFKPTERTTKTLFFFLLFSKWLSAHVFFYPQVRVKSIGSPRQELFQFDTLQIIELQVWPTLSAEGEATNQTEKYNAEPAWRAPCLVWFVTGAPQGTVLVLFKAGVTTFILESPSCSWMPDDDFRQVETRKKNFYFDFYLFTWCLFNDIFPFLYLRPVPTQKKKW